MTCDTNHQNNQTLEKICKRCGREVLGSDKLYPTTWYDEDEGTDKVYMICWDCDFELMNGRGEMTDDVWDIESARAEEAYEFDSINNQRYW